ncbi:DUF885 domain-containing protein [Agarilytica rhodophyticola]|uniref:DUF885 domain-containing protein n=1 Tax=Agarilytica rhodophyticola TaxID=1737490 RepID=UPI000B344C17|nr:DUF885 domain-containing protein [Agarilytica rhodophyticola]
MYKQCIVLAFALGIVACDQAEQAKTDIGTSVTMEKSQEPKAIAESESARLNAWFDVKYQEQLQFSPIQLTFLGKKDLYDEIDDLTEAAELKQLEWKKQTVDELKSKFDYNKLDPEAKTSYDLWLYQYQRQKEAAQFIGQPYVLHQMNGLQAFLPQFLINFHKVTEISDMQAYIKRISAVANGMNQLLVRAKRYAKNGVRAPRFAYEGVMQQAGNVITGKPFANGDKDSPLWADANSKIDSLLNDKKIDEAQAKQLKEDVKQALLNDFLPSYQAVVEWYKSDIANTDEIATGVSKRKGGLDFYNNRLKASTTTDLTAEEIHQIGIKEVDRLTAEMEAIKTKTGFKGSLKDFFGFIKKDDQFYYPNTDDGRLGYIKDTEVFLGYINEKLPEYFGILPKADLVVKRVEAFREQDGAAQHYFPGTPDGSRPGIYYAHLSDMRSMPKNEMEAIAYHEGNPGHHMQISIAQELQSVPEFRKQARFTAYSEGWALYSELLAKEMGAYKNDYNDFGRLITEIWRAVRLVVDTGLHAKGWTEAQAIEYFKDKAPIAEGAVVSEVQRYLVIPGQATSYKIGMIKILELREKAKKALGEKFDIRKFHDVILGGGAVPLNILERRVDEWIASIK